MLARPLSSWPAGVILCRNYLVYEWVSLWRSCQKIIFAQIIVCVQLMMFMNVLCMNDHGYRVSCVQIIFVSIVVCTDYLTNHRVHRFSCVWIIWYLMWDLLLGTEWYYLPLVLLVGLVSWYWFSLLLYSSFFCCFIYLINLPTFLWCFCMITVISSSLPTQLSSSYTLLLY